MRRLQIIMTERRGLAIICCDRQSTDYTDSRFKVIDVTDVLCPQVLGRTVFLPNPYPYRGIQTSVNKLRWIRRRARFFSSLGD